MSHKILQLVPTSSADIALPNPGAIVKLRIMLPCNTQLGIRINVSIIRGRCCLPQAPAASSSSGSQARGASGGVDSLPGHLRDLKLTGDRRESKDQVGRLGHRIQAFAIFSLSRNAQY